MQKYLILFFFVISFLYSASAQKGGSVPLPEQNSDTLFMQEKDKVAPTFFQNLFSGNLNWNFVITPLVSYQPETLWGFGVAGAYYIKTKKKEGRTGIIGFNSAYTLKKQFNFNINSTVYFGKNQKWFLYANVGYRHFPDNFYGIGNKYGNLLLTSNNKLAPIPHNSNNFYLTLQPQRYVFGNWILGSNVTLRWENINGLNKNIEQRYAIKGLDNYLMVGVGEVLSYDSRNNFFYPSKGMFFKYVVSHYEPFIGSSYRMTKVQVDYRQYLKIYREFIFAYQFISECVIGHDKPFQMLPTLGGSDILRGVREKVWRDDMMAALQAELRIPIWKIFRASVFCSMGDVYNFKKWEFTMPKIGYGVGLRVQFNKSKANLRFDVAKQNYSKDFAYYITVNEAF
jgi:hypothetical protein